MDKETKTLLEEAEWALVYMHNCISDYMNLQYVYTVNNDKRVIKTIQDLQKFLIKNKPE